VVSVSRYDTGPVKLTKTTMVAFDIFFYGNMQEVLCDILFICTECGSTLFACMVEGEGVVVALRDSCSLHALWAVSF
jgi:hypothetical protein